VVNLRSVIVPIVELRLKFGLANVALDGTTVAQRVLVLVDIKQPISSAERELVQGAAPVH